MDDCNSGVMMATLENAIEELTFDLETHPRKRLRTGEAKSSQPSDSNAWVKRVEHTGASSLPPLITWNEWQELVPPEGIAAQDLLTKLGVTPETLEDYKLQIKYSLDGYKGLFHRKGEARYHRIQTALTTDKVRGFIPQNGIRMSELIQGSGVSRCGFSALMDIIRQVAVVRDWRIYLKEHAPVGAEEERDDDETLDLLMVVYKNDDLSVSEVRQEHRTMQRCIDELRETIRSQYNSSRILHQRVQRFQKDQFYSIAQAKREFYAGSLIGNSLIRVKVTLRRSSPAAESESETDEVSAVDEDESEETKSADGGSQKNDGDVEMGGEAGDAEVNEDEDVDEQSEHDERVDENEEDEQDNDNEEDDDEAEDAEPEITETTIDVKANLASTLSKLRRAMVPFLEKKFIEAIDEALKQDEGNVNALLLEGDDTENGVWLQDITSDESKKKYRGWYERNATHSEREAGGVEMNVYLPEEAV